jgi:glycosyltransferase involved in cell wall biosynthesis
VDAQLKSSLGVTWHLVPEQKGLPLLRMWHFDRLARRQAAALPVDVTIGFGRTTAHDLHRAGGGAHALYSRLLPWYKRLSPKNLLELKLERQLFEGGATAGFVFNSARVMAQVQGLYPACREKGSVIYTAVDSQNYQPAPDRLALRQKVCEKMRTDPAQKVGLFVSLSHRRKGLDALLRAWQGIDATLWIAGKPLDKTWLGKIHALGLAERIRSVPVTSELVPLYQSADWFVHPTLYDACANTVLQSMCCGLPGLISSQDGAVDHLRDGKNGFLLGQPQDPNSINALLRRALAVPEEERLAMGTQAREAMLPLTWEAHLAGWTPLLEG